MILLWPIRTGSGRWFSSILRIRTGSDQDWTQTEKFHSLLISGVGLPRNPDRIGSVHTSVATAVFFHWIWGFSVLSRVLGFLLIICFFTLVKF